MAQTKTVPTINQSGYDMLEQHILRASAPSPAKGHDQLVWDEAKRYILACIVQNFKVIH